MDSVAQNILNEVDEMMVLEFDINLSDTADNAIKFLTRKNQLVQAVINERIRAIEGDTRLSIVEFQAAIAHLDSVSRQLDAFFNTQIDEMVAFGLSGLKL